MQLNEALRSNEGRSTFSSESVSGVPSISKETGDGVDSSTVTKKLEEELKKRDALIEVCYMLIFYYFGMFYLINDTFLILGHSLMIMLLRLLLMPFCTFLHFQTVVSAPLFIRLQPDFFFCFETAS